MIPTEVEPEENRRSRGSRDAAGNLCFRLDPSPLRAPAPLPKEEFLAFKRCIAELAAIGRNIKQMARTANEAGRAPNSVREEFRAIIKICEALRDNVKTFLKANETSWRTGHV